MALCHECGEQVAENDIFCPHCGISLEPISLGGGDAAAEFEKTVVMLPPKKSNKGFKIQVDPDKKATDVEPVSAAPGDKTQKDKITPPEPELLRNVKSKDIDIPANVLAQVEKTPAESIGSEAPFGALQSANPEAPTEP